MGDSGEVRPSTGSRTSPSGPPGEDVRNGPSVSVVIGAHTRVEFLKRAVQSVAVQRPDELIVVKYARDAGLDDELAGLGARVHVSREPCSGGKFAEGIEIATGKVVAFLDDDDVFLPGKIARIRSVLNDPRVVFYANGYVPFTDTPPERGETGPLQLFETALGDQYRQGLKPVLTSCASVRREMLLPWLDELRTLTVADHPMFMKAVTARKWIAMDRSILTGFHLVQVGRVVRAANTIWYRPGASAQRDIAWMLDLLDSETGGVRKTLTPMVVNCVVHFVFLTGETEFKEYRRTMRALLDGVGVRRPLTVPSILMFGYPLSPKLAISLNRMWKSFVGNPHVQRG